MDEPVQDDAVGVEKVTGLDGIDDRLAELLVARGLVSLRGLPGGRMKMIEIVLPRPTEPLVAVLEAAGFDKLRVLMQMRLDRSLPALW